MSDDTIPLASMFGHPAPMVMPPPAMSTPPEWAQGLVKAAAAPLTDAGAYLGGMMGGQIPFHPAEAMQEAVKFGSALVGPKAGIGSLAMFAGPMAKTADHAALDLAQQMATRGMDRRQIWDATGWFSGADGKWRFEIPDNAAKMTGLRNFPMGSVMEHPELYQAYPEMERAQVHGVVPPRAQGAAYPNGSVGIVPKALNNPGVLLHEGQHLIQQKEGFAPGGNPSEFLESAKREMPNEKFDSPIVTKAVADAKRASDAEYNRLAGEVEARNVQARLNMTPEQRKETPPWRTQEIPASQQIVRIPLLSMFK